jgi:hypothetical protein
MKIISFVLRGIGLVENILVIIIISVLLINAKPIYSEIMETTKYNKLISVKSDIARAASLHNILTIGEQNIELKYGYPTAQSIKNLVDLSDFNVSTNVDYIDIRVYNDDGLFLRYFPNENGLSLKLFNLDQKESSI